MDLKLARKVKHRELERKRHHKTQSLIKDLEARLPLYPGKLTQCQILRQAKDYIEFLVNQYNLLVTTYDFQPYPSSQSSTGSSQRSTTKASSSNQTELTGSSSSLSQLHPIPTASSLPLSQQTDSTGELVIDEKFPVDQFIPDVYNCNNLTAQDEYIFSSQSSTGSSSSSHLYIVTTPTASSSLPSSQQSDYKEEQPIDEKINIKIEPGLPMISDIAHNDGDLMLNHYTDQGDFINQDYQSNLIVDEGDAVDGPCLTNMIDVDPDKYSDNYCHPEFHLPSRPLGYRGSVGYVNCNCNQTVNDAILPVNIKSEEVDFRYHDWTNETIDERLWLNDFEDPFNGLDYVQNEFKPRSLWTDQNGNIYDYDVGGVKSYHH